MRTRRCRSGWVHDSLSCNGSGHKHSGNANDHASNREQYDLDGGKPRSDRRTGGASFVDIAKRSKRIPKARSRVAESVIDCRRATRNNPGLEASEEAGIRLRDVLSNCIGDLDNFIRLRQPRGKPPDLAGQRSLPEHQGTKHVLT